MRKKTPKQSMRTISSISLPKLSSSTRSTKPPLRKQLYSRHPLTNQQKSNSQHNHPHFVTAQSYAVYDDTLTFLAGHNNRDKRQIASLTKMMTLLASLKLCQRYQVKIKVTYFRISVTAANVTGTSAYLQPKFWISVQDLLYGLMLASGNDAATVLAQNFGAYLYYESKGQMKALKSIRTLDITNDYFNTKLYSTFFIKFMNKLAQDYQMRDTVFSNPHGLNNQENYSTVHDLAILTQEMYRFGHCAEIIKTKEYIGRMGNTPHLDDFTEERQWMNSNRLLWRRGYIGAKTGQTLGAGNCLSSIYEHQHKIYYIIVLASRTKQDRFKDTQKLIQRYLSNIDK